MLLETERLILTEFAMDMAKAVHENSLDEDNRRFVPDEVWESVEDAEETLAYLMNVYGDFEEPQVYPILTKDSGDNIGYVQLVPLDDGVFEVGYHIAKKYTGKGYATEAIKAFLPLMAEKAETDKVYGICLKENTASVRVMEKCGFVQEFAGIGEYQGEKREIIKEVWNA